MEQEDLSHFRRKILGELFRIPALSRQHRERFECRHRVTVHQRTKESVELRLRLDDRTGSDELVERTQGVARRTSSESHGCLNGRVVGTQSGGVLNLAQQ